MKAERKITAEYLNEFIGAIKNGNPVRLVQADNLLAVDHPSKGWLVVQLVDKVVEGQKVIPDGSTEE